MQSCSIGGMGVLNMNNSDIITLCTQNITQPYTTMLSVSYTVNIAR